MSQLNKVDVPVAVHHKSKLDLSCDHITTMSFMRLQPVNYRHMIQGERINMSVNSFVRPAPLVVPTYGEIRQNVRMFFVPYRLVFPQWDNFINDVIGSDVNQSSLVQSAPILSNKVIVDWFITNSTTVAQGQLYDFNYNSLYYKLTAFGRRAYKLLVSLGYKPLFAKTTADVEYNALALLAYAKIYCDWYANSQYLNSQDVLIMERMFKHYDPMSPLSLSNIQFTAILSLVNSVVYDNEDYYVNAWDNPMSPNQGQQSGFTFLDPTSSGGYQVNTNAYGTPEMSTNIALNIGTQYIHDALKKLTNYQKRHALAGARAIDRVLAQYGVVTDSLKTQRSIYIGAQKTLVDIGSVYATSNSSNSQGDSNTGDFAGAGYGKSEKVFEFTAEEAGILIAMASIIPSGKMVQGYDRNNLHLSKTDFYTPEFDSLGVQVLEKGEVYVSNSDSFVTQSASEYRNRFGFTGRYGEYKRPKSFLTGDISLPTVMANGGAWHLYRVFDDASFGSVSGLVHSLDFTRGESDASQYGRIFQYTDNDLDAFFCFLHFNTGVWSPCLPLFETYDFEEEEGKKVPTENGNKVN